MVLYHSDMAAFFLFLLNPIIFTLLVLAPQKSWTNDFELPEMRKVSETDRHRFEKSVRNPAETNSLNIKNIKVSVIYPGHQQSDYWRRNLLAFKSRLSELKIGHRIKEHFTRPNIDINKQEQLLRKALEANPDYIIFTLNSNQQARWVSQIINQQKSKVILQNITTPIVSWGTNQPLIYVGFDHQTGATKLAEHISKSFKNQIDYGIVYFGQGLVAKQRTEPLIKHLSQSKKLRLTAAYYSNGSVEDAYKKTLNLITKHPTIKFIYCTSTDVAIGAIKARRKLNRNDIVINGWGGGEPELEQLKLGELNFTVMRMNDDSGVAMAEAIKLDLAGKGNEIPLTFSGEMVIVTNKTPPEEINRLRSRAFRYSK